VQQKVVVVVEMLQQIILYTVEDPVVLVVVHPIKMHQVLQVLVFPVKVLLGVLQVETQVATEVEVEVALVVLVKVDLLEMVE
jgi:hypothetical protein